MINSGTWFDIAGVERETGIGKDTLRVWERRYGFPAPARNEREERNYPEEQVERLRLIKRLIDSGMRPAKVVGLDTEALNALLARQRPLAPPAEALDAFIDLIKNRNSSGLRVALSRALHAQGLEAFLSRVVSPLNAYVGEAWMRGELHVFEEHLYSNQVGDVLRQASASLQRPEDRPSALLTTLPGEEHVLGLLMAEAMLSLHGVACIMLGAQTPIRDIVLAADIHRVDIVALSFSTAIQTTQIKTGLQQTRDALPQNVALWAGGAGAARLKRGPAGVELMARLDELPGAVRKWRAAAH